jgi:hypothetical protein
LGQPHICAQAAPPPQSLRHCRSQLPLAPEDEVDDVDDELEEVEDEDDDEVEEVDDEEVLDDEELVAVAMSVQRPSATCAQSADSVCEVRSCAACAHVT